MGEVVFSGFGSLASGLHSAASHSRQRLLHATTSTLEHCQIELTKARGVGEDVYFDNLSAVYCKAEHGHWLSIGEPCNNSRRSIHERQLGRPSDSRECQCFVGHRSRTADHSQRALVGSEHDIGIEHREERIKVAGARSREEGIDGLSVAGDIRVRQ